MLKATLLNGGEVILDEDVYPLNFLRKNFPGETGSNWPRFVSQRSFDLVLVTVEGSYIAPRMIVTVREVEDPRNRDLYRCEATTAFGERCQRDAGHSVRHLYVSPTDGRSVEWDD